MHTYHSTARAVDTHRHRTERYRLCIPTISVILQEQYSARMGGSGESDQGQTAEERVGTGADEFKMETMHYLHCSSTQSSLPDFDQAEDAHVKFTCGYYKTIDRCFRRGDALPSANPPISGHNPVRIPMCSAHDGSGLSVSGLEIPYGTLVGSVRCVSCY